MKTSLPVKKKNLIENFRGTVDTAEPKRHARAAIPVASTTRDLLHRYDMSAMIFSGKPENIFNDKMSMKFNKYTLPPYMIEKNYTKQSSNI